MDIFSVEQKERLRREEVAERLHKIELEIESDERELEIEVTW